MHQIALQIGNGLIGVAQLGVRQPTVPVLWPRLRHQDHQALLNRQHAFPVFLGAVDFFQIAQHAADDFARRCSLQIQPQRHVEFIDQPVATAVRIQPLGQFFTAERMAGHGIKHCLPHRQMDLHQKMSRKTHAAH